MTFFDQRFNSRIKLLPPFDRIRDRMIGLSHQYNDWETLKKETVHQLAIYEIHGIEDTDQQGDGIYVNDDDCSDILTWVNGPHFVSWLMRSPEPKPEWLQKQLVFEALKSD